jgi:hypothetical protein
MPKVKGKFYNPNLHSNRMPKRNPAKMEAARKKMIKDANIARNKLIKAEKAKGKAKKGGR